MSSKFLVVVEKTVVDQPFIAAVPEVPAVPEVLASDGTTVLQPAIPAIPAVAEVPMVTHQEIDGTYIEDSAEQVAKNLLDDEAGTGRNYRYYEIRFNAALMPQLHAVRLKPGPRAPAPAREVVTIEADGQDSGSVIVDA